MWRKGSEAEGVKREKDIAEEKASAPASRPWLSVAGPLSQHQGLRGCGHIMKACLSSHLNITESAWKNSAPRATFINPARIPSLQPCAKRLPHFSSTHTLSGKNCCHIQPETCSIFHVPLIVLGSLLFLPAVRKLAKLFSQVSLIENETIAQDKVSCCYTFGCFCLMQTAPLFVFFLSTSLS